MISLSLSSGDLSSSLVWSSWWRVTAKEPLVLPAELYTCGMQATDKNGGFCTAGDSPTADFPAMLGVLSVDY